MISPEQYSIGNEQVSEYVVGNIADQLPFPELRFLFPRGFFRNEQKGLRLFVHALVGIPDWSKSFLGEKELQGLKPFVATWNSGILWKGREAAQYLSDHYPFMARNPSDPTQPSYLRYVHGFWNGSYHPDGEPNKDKMKTHILSFPAFQWHQQESERISQLLEFRKELQQQNLLGLSIPQDVTKATAGKFYRLIKSEAMR